MKQHLFDRRSGGFTLIELMVSIAVVGILLAMAASKLTGQSDQARAHEAQRFLVEDVPAALIEFARSNADTVRLNDVSQLTGVGTTTAWGAEWSITSNARANGAHSIRYPIGGHEPVVRGEALVQFLTGNGASGNKRLTLIRDARYSNGNLDITYSSLR